MNQRLRRLRWKFPVHGVWSPRKGKWCFSEQGTAGAGAREQTPARVGLARVLVTKDAWPQALLRPWVGKGT